MEIYINNGHKKMIITEELNPVKVNCHVKNNTININLYSGCLDFNSIDNLPIVDKELYDIDCDVNSGLYVMDEVETDNISSLFSNIYESKIDNGKCR